MTDSTLPPHETGRKLGKRLSELLDEDQWADCEPLLLSLLAEIERLKAQVAELQRRLPTDQPPMKGIIE